MAKQARGTGQVRDHFIGIDLGRSAGKSFAITPKGTLEDIFPCALIQGQERLTFNEIAAEAEADTVRFDSEVWWVGHTALKQGIDLRVLGRSDTWMMTQEHDILLRAAIRRLQIKGLLFEPGRSVITLGVPSRVARDRHDLVEGLAARAKKLFADKDGASPLVNVVVQPMGVVGAYTLTDEGCAREGLNPDQSTFAVIDVGQFTTDFTAIVQGSPAYQATRSTDGIEVISPRISGELQKHGWKLFPQFLDTLMTNPVARGRGQVLDLTEVRDRALAEILHPKIIAEARISFGESLLQTADNILVAGGGAPAVIEAIQREPDMRHAVMVENPRECVARGFARLSALTPE